MHLLQPQGTRTSVHANRGVDNYCDPYLYNSAAERTQEDNLSDVLNSHCLYATRLYVCR